MVPDLHWGGGGQELVLLRGRREPTMTPPRGCSPMSFLGDSQGRKSLRLAGKGVEGELSLA